MKILMCFSIMSIFINVNTSLKPAKFPKENSEIQEDPLILFKPIMECPDSILAMLLTPNSWEAAVRVKGLSLFHPHGRPGWSSGLNFCGYFEK